MSTPPIIQLDEVHFTYSGGSHSALSAITLSIQPGEIIGIIGANGAGKSTLCYLLAGLIPSFFNGNFSGTATINDKEIANIDANKLPYLVGLVLQNSRLQLSHMCNTVYEEVAFGLENLGVPREIMLKKIDQALKMTGISHMAERSPYTLSGGEQQRLAIASILAMDSPVLIFDEPTSLLDPVGRREVLSVIMNLSKSGHTIIIAEHHLEWIAEYTDRVVALEAGKILVQGDPKEIMSLPEIQSSGIGWTRFTQASALYLEKTKSGSPNRLPITLEQAIHFFQTEQGNHGN
jgi:energy-coupling factor transporter ATP-binding protein EcfA2